MVLLVLEVLLVRVVLAGLMVLEGLWVHLPPVLQDHLGFLVDLAGRPLLSVLVYLWRPSLAGYRKAARCGAVADWRLVMRVVVARVRTVVDT